MKFDRNDFLKAVELWTGWNAGINVVSRKDIGMLYEHHILHSLSIACGGFIESGDSVLDLGTGGGFPGIPLAMVLPDCSFTLCDSIGKKVKVAQAVSEGLGLKNVKCINARAESIPETFDWVVSRAVTSLDNFYPWVKGKYRKGILCLKGGDVAAEIAQFTGKSGVDPTLVSVYPVNSWIDDEYYNGKYIVRISK